MIKIMNISLMVFGFALLAGNINAETPIQDIEGVPGWVVEKGKALEQEKEYLFGVGSSPEIKNSALRRQVAETLARKDLAGTLRAEIDAKTIVDLGEGEYSSIIKEVVKATLRRSEIMQYWEHPEQNTAYAMARISKKDFKENIRKMIADEKK